MTGEIVRLKYIANFGYGDALPKDEEARGEVKVYGSNGPYSVTVKANTLSPVIIVGRKGSYGKINWSMEACFASDTTFFIDSRFTKNDLRWLYYVLQTLGLDEGSSEAAVPGLNRETAYKEKVPLHPLPIQRQIAAYLDRETARINALIAAKERLLQLLAEKRQALIARAVTRGLDENVRLKDSGVEWLGEVPEGWEVVKMKYLVSITGGGTPSKANSEYWKGDIPWVSPKDMKSLFIDSTEDHISETALAESVTKLVPVGSVLIVVRSGILRHTLPVGINTLPVALNQDMKALIPDPNRLRSTFLSLLLFGLQNQLLQEWVKQGTTVESVEMEFFTNTYFPLPSLIDQELIVSYIETQTTRIDSLHQATERTITLLKERRAALIAAAVTGKIAAL